MNRKTTLPNKATTVLALPECWILEDDNQYNHLQNSVRDKMLPIIEKEYQEILIEMGIPYRIIKFKNGNEILEYWNPDCIQEKELTLPLYENVENEYVYTHRYYTGKVKSELMLKKARELEKRVAEKKSEFKQKKLLQEIKNAVERKESVGFYTCFRRNLDEDEIEGIKILPVKDTKGRPTNYFAIFNLEEIKEKEVVKLEVEEGMEGLFVGTKGWQVKDWCTKLGVKRINVVGI